MMRHAFPHAIGVRTDSLRGIRDPLVEQHPGYASSRCADSPAQPTTRADNIRDQLRATRTIENARSPMTAIGMSHQTS